MIHLQVVEECLEVVLSVQLEEEEMAEEVMMVTVMVVVVVCVSVNNGAADMESPNNINNSPFATALD